MDTLKFIKSDVEKDRAFSGARLAGVAFGVFLLPLALGALLRSDLSGVFAPFPLVSNVVAALFLAVFPVVYRYRTTWGRRGRFALGAAWFFALILSADRIFTGVDPGFASDSEFWQENVGCFAKGAVGAAIVSIWLGYFVFRASSLPSRPWRAFAALSAGLSATVLLGVHCDSASPAHVAIGHVGPALLIGAAGFFVFEFFFRRIIREKFPDLHRSIDRPDRLV